MEVSGLQTYFLVVGITLLVLAAVLFYRRLSTKIRGISTVGQVVDHEVRTIDDSTSYLPVVEFHDLQGMLHRFTSVAGGSDRHPKVGAEVTVRYLRSNPKVVYIQSFLHMWAAPIACTVLGLAAIAALWV
ncbi:DUF3592 domain-containing protein [Methyloglobulus sp.]|uniref:DUF3592 domain-containing protein n=1 Tax=Methyloglobulus sp. TaxID=2518622 RepID=UPI0032B77385